MKIDGTVSSRFNLQSGLAAPAVLLEHIFTYFGYSQIFIGSFRVVIFFVLSGFWIHITTMQPHLNDSYANLHRYDIVNVLMFSGIFWLCLWMSKLNYFNGRYVSAISKFSAAVSNSLYLFYFIVLTIGCGLGYFNAFSWSVLFSSLILGCLFTFVLYKLIGKNYVSIHRFFSSK